MKFLLTTALLSLSLLLSTNLAQAQSNDEQAVAAAAQRLNLAMLEGDAATLDELTLDALSYGHSSGRLENKTEYVEALASGQADFESLSASNQQITLSGNTALVRQELEVSGVDSGNAFDVRLGVLLVWQKQDGKWKLLARQAYRL